jgi:two-component system, OmpR family, phosphate regulon sensor histidine kinase PhoR
LIRRQPPPVAPATPRWSLQTQLIVAFVGVILITMVPLAALVPSLVRAHQLAALENRLADEAALVADYVGSRGTEGSGSAPRFLAPDPWYDELAKRLGERTDIRITIIALDGTVVGESHQDLAQVGNHAGRREVQDALAHGHGSDLHRSETVGYEMLYVAVPIQRGAATIGIARAALPLSEVDRLVGTLERGMLLAAASAALLALVVAVVAARTIARPLTQLTRLAATLAADPAGTGGPHARGGDESPRPSGRLPASGDGPVIVGPWPPGEVAQLGATLDRLVSAVQQSLQRVTAERDRLDAVLANLADGVVMVNSAGRVARLNPAVERLLGIPRERAAGRTVAELLRDHELVELVERARHAAAPPTVATAFLEWHRPRRFLRAAVTAFGEGQARQTLLVLQDLTELRRLETVRRDFVLNVSHELRTPIAAIKAMVETLHDGAIDDVTAARDFVERIEQEVDGLHQLVEELLELSRLESGRAELALVPIEAGQLVQTAVRRLAPLAQRARVALSAEVEPGLPAVQADPERMGQVLVGVIHNAIKFTPPGGAIVVRAAAEGDRVRLSVADSGVGLEPHEAGRIFERFYKVRQHAPEHGDESGSASGGTGLGLAIARHTVQLHSGTIWAESAGPGRGTTVHIALPTSAERAAMRPAEPLAPAADRP